MKRLLYFPALAALCAAIIFSSCQKDDDKGSETDNQTMAASQADDESRVSSELDAIAADATVVVESNPATSGDYSVLDEMICDASITVNTDTDPMSVTIDYNGANCSVSRKRSGKVILTMAKGSQWKNEGTSVTIKFQDLKITRNSDQKSITINGSKTYTNVSGGLLSKLATTGTIIHKITSSGLSIKFDNGAAREWQVARQYTFTYNNGVVINISGLHTEGDLGGIVEWGTNRFGNAFTTSISSPLVARQDCNFRVGAGMLTHTTPAFSATATFGLNASGEVTGCPGTGKYYYKLTAVGANGNSLNTLVAY